MDALTKIQSLLLRQVGKAIHDHDLIERGDRILVAISGGKDSFTMLHLLRALQQRAPVPFAIVAVNLDQGHPGFPKRVLPRWMAENGYEFVQLTEDTYRVVKEKIAAGQTQCSLCSRLRRGILYTAAERLGCTKIALGHHRDDLIHTFLLNQFFAGTCATMPPKLFSNDGRSTVIRPLAYCAERDIARFAEAMRFPLIPCDLCGSQSELQRVAMKRLVDGVASQYPQVRASLLAAMGNVKPSHLLDRNLHRAQVSAE